MAIILKYMIIINYINTNLILHCARGKCTLCLMFNLYTIKGTYAWGFCFIMLTYENVEVTQLTTVSQAYFCATVCALDHQRSNSLYWIIP